VSRSPLPPVATLAFLLACGACGSSGGSDSLPPITGVVVRAESLTNGRGCGRGATQIFKYAAVVFGRGGSGAFDQFVAGNVYDCFTDGLFVDLPLSSTGTFDYRVQVYAYNEAAYRAAGDQQVRFAATGSPATLIGTNPTLTTTCAAQQIELVQSLAFCKPLTIGTAGIDDATKPAAPAVVELSLASFAGPEGGTLACDAQFARVRSRFGISGASGAAFGDVTEVRCTNLGPTGLEPAKLRIDPAAAPASYVIELALLQADGSVAGQTTCRAETSPGLQSVPVCSPVQ
jgi:hypothetical protein